MIVLVDIGHNRIKWAVFNQNNLSEQISYEYNLKNYIKIISELVNGWVVLPKPPSRILISSVAEKEFNANLEQQIWDSYELEPEYLVPGKSFQKLKNGYSEPDLLAIDRWLSLVGAYSLNNNKKSIHSAFCVIDCSTAITVDAVDSNGKHLGGLIIPGIRLMEQSLITNTKSIKSNKELVSNHNACDQSINKNSFLANNTNHAMIGGIYYAVVTYIENIVADLVALINSNYKVYLTGRDADQLINMLNSDVTRENNMIEYELNHSLVWQGMLSLI
jgi:type III pantothenate kinase